MAIQLRLFHDDPVRKARSLTVRQPGSRLRAARPAPRRIRCAEFVLDNYARCPVLTGLEFPSNGRAISQSVPLR